MPYLALPDHRIPYDNDGTIVYVGTAAAGADTALTSAQLVELNDNDSTVAVSRAGAHTNGRIYFFFPEQREITGLWAEIDALGLGTQNMSGQTVQGSNDTGNGEDGTWETASLPAGLPAAWHATTTGDFDDWRAGIKAVSFTGPKKNLRLSQTNSATSAGAALDWLTVQIYGEPAAGQMAHDLVYINHDDTPGVAFAAAEDFGDQPLGTTVVRQFRIKNTSASRTATNINIQCNDADFVMGESAAGPWVVTINLANLVPGAQSPTYYVRLTTPAQGAALRPRFARIVTVCDAGFFG